MMEPLRVDVYEAREKVEAGEALLVCAYESDAKFRRARLEGAVSFREFAERLPSLSTGEEIVLYCG